MVHRMQLVEQTRFGCHELKSKNMPKTNTVLIHRNIF